MRWFLRFFQYVHDLEAEAVTYKAIAGHHQNLINDLRDEVIRLRNDRDSATDEVFKLRKDHADSLKMVSNWQATLAGSSRVPFPDVHVEPAPPEIAAATYEPIPAARTPRDIQKEAVNESRRLAFERRQKINSHADTMGLGEV